MQTSTGDRHKTRERNQYVWLQDSGYSAKAFYFCHTNNMKTLEISVISHFSQTLMRLNRAKAKLLIESHVQFR